MPYAIEDTPDVFIGNKPIMNYVTAVTIKFNQQNLNEAVIKGRGMFTAKAIDVAELITKRFMHEQVRVDSIKIDSEEFNRDDKRVRVSTIEINLKKV